MRYECTIAARRCLGVGGAAIPFSRLCMQCTLMPSAVAYRACPRPSHDPYQAIIVSPRSVDPY